MDNFKRPNHPDFMDSSELAKIEFTGVRHNSLSHYQEMWVLGKKVFELPATEVQTNPEKWNAMFADFFGCKHVETESQKGN